MSFKEAIKAARLAAFKAGTFGGPYLTHKLFMENREYLESYLIDDTWDICIVAYNKLEEVAHCFPLNVWLHYAGDICTAYFPGEVDINYEAANPKIEMHTDSSYWDQEKGYLISGCFQKALLIMIDEGQGDDSEPSLQCFFINSTCPTDNALEHFYMSH